MSPRLSTAARIGLLAAGLVLVLGTLFVAFRPASYLSEAKVVLVPTTLAQDPALPSILDGFDSSGASGTTVELLDSEDTLAAAGHPPIDLTVRAVPDTRVVEVSATGSGADVRLELTSVIQAAIRTQSELRDLWRIRMLQQPTVAVPSPPSTLVMLLATALLALLAGTVAWVAVETLARRATGPASGPGAGPLNGSGAVPTAAGETSPWGA